MLENQENWSRVRSLSLRRLPQNSLCAHYRKVSHRNRARNHVIWRTGNHGIRLRGPLPWPLSEDSMTVDLSRRAFLRYGAGAVAGSMVSNPAEPRPKVGAQHAAPL